MIQISFLQLLIGTFLALFVALISYRAKVLSRSGALAATLLGIVVFGLGGIEWALLLLAFFVSSSGLSKVAKGSKQKLVEKFSKGSTRDSNQVLANGGVAAVFVLLHLFFPQQAWPWLGFAGSMAAVNSDTWATELGVLSSRGAYHILSTKKVEKGTSCAISFLGTIASFSGGLLIAALAVIFWPDKIADFNAQLWWVSLFAIAFAGLFGSIVDSILGASLQAIYYCPTCEKETERTPFHICGTPTTFKRGWKWLNNDWVNAVCALAGGLFMVVFALVK